MFGGGGVVVGGVRYQDKYLPESGEVAQWAEPEDDGAGLDDDSDDDDGAGAAAAGGAADKGWFGSTAVGSFLASVTGNKVRCRRSSQGQLQPGQQRAYACIPVPVDPTSQQRDS